MSTWISIAEIVYPTGSIYLSFSNVSPASLFGGSWEQISDKFLYPSSNAGDTGGEASVKLYRKNMPKNFYQITNQYGEAASADSDNVMHITSDLAPYTVVTGTNITYYPNTPRGWFTFAGNEAYPCYYGGLGEKHNNIPPYITVFCWRRIS